MSPETVKKNSLKPSRLAGRPRLARADGALPPDQAFGVSVEDIADERLAAVLDRPVTVEEADAWTRMTPENRKLALSRAGALNRWQHERAEWTAGEAAEAAGLKLSRFYDMAATWERAGKSLFNLGLSAKPQGDRKPRFDPGLLNELQGIVAKAAAGKSKMPISAIVEQMTAEIDAGDRVMPSVNTLRNIAARELRRLKAEGQVGTRPGLDVLGTGMFDAEGRHLLLFAVIDRTSKLIMGWSIGFLDDSWTAYAAAARDAVQRIEAVGDGSMPWAPDVGRVDVVVGDDLAQWRKVKAEWPTTGSGVELELVTAPRRFGRYFKSTTGLRIGRLQLVPPIATKAVRDAFTGPGLDVKEAKVRVDVEIAKYNGEILDRLLSEVEGEPRPPERLVSALTCLAGSG